MRFELVQRSEFDDYYYQVCCNDEIICIIEFVDNEWCVSLLEEDEAITYDGLIALSEKVKELNASAKDDKIFGFL